MTQHVSVDDDYDEDKPLFFKKKKDIGTQTPGISPGAHSAHGHAHGHGQSQGAHGSHHTSHGENSPQGGTLSMGVSGHNASHRKTIIQAGINGPAGAGAGTGTSSGVGGGSVEDMSMTRREARFGVPGESHTSRRMSSNLGAQSGGAEGGTENASRPKKSLRGFLEKFGKGSGGGGGVKVSLFGNMDANTVAEVEDKLSRAREIERKGIDLELRCEKLVEQEAEMARKLAEVSLSLAHTHTHTLSLECVLQSITIRSTPFIRIFTFLS